MCVIIPLTSWNLNDVTLLSRRHCSCFGLKFQSTQAYAVYRKQQQTHICTQTMSYFPWMRSVCSTRPWRTPLAFQAVSSGESVIVLLTKEQRGKKGKANFTNAFGVSLLQRAPLLETLSPDSHSISTEPNHSSFSFFSLSRQFQNEITLGKALPAVVHMLQLWPFDLLTMYMIEMTHYSWLGEGGRESERQQREREQESERERERERRDAMNF